VKLTTDSINETNDLWNYHEWIKIQRSYY